MKRGLPVGLELCGSSGDPSRYSPQPSAAHNAKSLSPLGQKISDPRPLRASATVRLLVRTASIRPPPEFNPMRGIVPACLVADA